VPLETVPFDASKVLSPEGQVDLILDAVKVGDRDYIVAAVQIVVKARGRVSVPEQG
jgi:DNA-binding phage protein